MSDQAKNALSRNRSAAACIVEGYRLYTANFKSMLRSSWLFAVAYAAAFSALSLLLATRLPSWIAAALQWSAISGSMGLEDNPTLTDDELQALAEMANMGIDVSNLAINPWLIAAAAGLIIVGGLVEIGVYSCAVGKMRGYESTGEMAPTKGWLRMDWPTYWRTLKGAAACLLLALGGSALLMGVVLWPLARFTAGQDNTLTMTITASLLGVVALLAVLPLSLVFFRYAVASDKPFWPQLKQSYTEGLHHYGFVFIVMLASLIVIVVSGAILALPGLILGIANCQAYLGLASGDPLGMPEYVAYISAVVFFIAGLMQVYIRCSAIFTGAFMDGAVRSNENDKARQAGKQDQTPQFTWQNEPIDLEK